MTPSSASPSDQVLGSTLIQVLPIWRQQIEFVRQQASSTTMDLLGSFMSVADELIKAALDSREAGEEVSARLNALFGEVEKLRKHTHPPAGNTDRNPDELEETVRHVFNGLLDLASSSQALSNVREQIQANVDQIFLALQNEDRLSQILQHITQDIQRMEEALQRRDNSDVMSPANWLARLKQTYTTAEEHATHDGRPITTLDSSVDFF